MEQRYSLRKTVLFALAGALGFGVAEAVLSVGLLAVYGTIGLPRESFSSPNLVGLDALSLIMGVTVSFLINERVTVRVVQSVRHGGERRFVRFLKFQAVSEAGNAAIVLVQLLLLATLSVSPPVGAIVGAIVTYPAVYLISIWFVWGEMSSDTVRSAR